MNDTTVKPSYLGLLNSIANAEAAAECYLDAWAAVTPRDDVRQIIATVALREGEHGKAFAKRLCELGFNVAPRSDGKAEDRMAIAAATNLTDREKFEKLGLAAPSDPTKPDFFAGMFADASMDIQTSALMGRYVAEERDSGRMLRGCYEQLLGEESGGSAAAPGSTEERLARIECLLEDLAKRLPAC